jgi:hypothetical protein
MAEHLGEARPPIDFVQEIGDAHVWHQPIEPTSEKARLKIVLGFWLRQGQSIAVKCRARALAGRQLFPDSRETPIE